MYSRILSLSLCAGLLAGCGGTTYGTGTSSEAQLLSDVAGMVALGSRERKAPIDYSSRPNLVRAPDGSNALPAPAEEDAATQAAYFPTDPEERRAAMLAGTDTTADGSELTVDGVDRPSIEKPKLIGDLDRDGHNDLKKSKVSREKVLALKKQARGATGSGPRRYLTDPPVEYRTPAETAPVGDVGEKEKKERKEIVNPTNAPL